MISKPLISKLLFLLLLLPIQVMAQTGSAAVTITAVNAANFPDVSVQFQIVNEAGFTEQDAQATTIELLENGVTVPMANRQWLVNQGGLRLHFITDVGVRVVDDGSAGRARWALAVQAITNFVQSQMQEDKDLIAITASEGQGVTPIIDFSNSSQDIIAKLADYDLPAGSPPAPPPPANPQTPTPPQTLYYSDPLATISQQLELMATAPEANQMAQAIILISPSIETNRNGVSAIAARAKELNIPIFVIHTYTDAESIRALADGSAGAYAAYSGGQGADLNTLYAELAKLRTQYTVTYRSTINTTGTQNLELRYTTPAGATLITNSSYDVTVSPPRVTLDPTIVNTTTITRRANEYTDNPDSVEPTAFMVIATVAFPDEHPRRILTANLLVNGSSVGNIQTPEISRIEIPWDLRTIDTIGTNSFTIEVEVRDELGLVSKTPPQQINVELTIPPAPIPTVSTIVITNVIASLIPTPTPIPCLSPEPVCSNVERPIRANPTETISLGVAFFALTVSLIVVVRYRTQVVAAGGRVTQVVSDFVERVTSRRVQAVAKAYLIVLEGDTNIGRSLEIFGDTPLGRSKQFATLLFQQQEEDSPISRLHATIVDHETHFALRDEDSANGTFLNGMRLEPLREEELQDGDEVELGQMERGGVKLLFQLAKKGSGVPDSSRITNPAGVRPPDLDQTMPGNNATIVEDEF